MSVFRIPVLFRILGAMGIDPREISFVGRSINLCIHNKMGDILNR